MSLDIFILFLFLCIDVLQPSHGQTFGQGCVLTSGCLSKSMIVFTESGQQVLFFFPPLLGILLQLQDNNVSALRKFYFDICVLVKVSYSCEKHTCLSNVRMEASALSSCSNSLSFSMSPKDCWNWTEHHI